VWQSAPSACLEAVRRGPEVATEEASRHRQAGLYPHPWAQVYRLHRAAGHSVLTAVARRWEMASVWPTGPVPKAVLRPQGVEVAGVGASGMGWRAILAVSQARRRARPAVSAEQESALPPAEPEAWVAAPHEAAASVPEAPREAVAVVAAAPHGEAAAAEEEPREEGAVVAAAPHEEAAAEEAVPHEEEVVAAVAARAGAAEGVLPRAAPVSAAEHPSAVPWAFRRGQVLPWLGP